MAYIIYNNDGTVLVTLPEGEIDSVTTSLDLIGKNVDNYGSFFNNDLVKILTSFANSEEPRSPQTGQLWFNTTLQRLTVYNGTEFKPTYGATVSGTAPITTSTGDIWYDTVNSQFKIYNGAEFKLVGPAVSALKGKFGLEPPPVTIKSDDTQIPQDVSVLYSYGSPVLVATTASFTMQATSATIYFNTSTATTVVEGITIIDDLDVKGDIYINGVRQVPPNKTLTSFYDITSYGNWRSGDTGNNLIYVNASNQDIRNDLALLFSTATYAINSEVRVLCYYNTQTFLQSPSTSVRLFRLEERYPPAVRWEPYNLYFSTWTNTVTNIVV